VRGAALTPYGRTTIAHELVHALDDQHHDRTELRYIPDRHTPGCTHL
jgi:hypothetical protein